MRIFLLCHAATSATRSAAFAGDESLEPREIVRTGAVAGSLPRFDQAFRAPSTRCRQTADALGLDASAHDALAGCDFGAWTGRTLDDVLTTTPDALTAWLSDPSATPHDGESLTALIQRVGGWLDTRGDARAILTIADPTVIRAALVHAVDAHPRAIWRFDVTPLSLITLVGNAGRWSVRF
ncbi:histidine phosphatase family protein [Pseudonocardia spinosispora]|uniref:histidine phosphatase family protein n=1 Tax=Pseudonocardia spinosispora TaxID=103441 RepID=UPI00040CADEC|nr:histidine phosphatase family protein [Pseudonocardia spinosispora]